jgi:hypothetical protein
VTSTTPDAPVVVFEVTSQTVSGHAKGDPSRQATYRF